MTLPTPSPGDIAFFSGNSLPDQVIKKVTNGKYSHVAMIRNSQTMIQAVGRGVVASPIGPYTALARTSTRLNPDACEWALALLERIVLDDDSYSYLDILADGIKKFLPAKLSGAPLLVAPSQFDCSALATIFLMVANYQWLPDVCYLDPHHISPNDLAQILTSVFFR